MAQCTCRTCGGEFDGAGPGARYCGDTCKPRCRLDDCDVPAVGRGLCAAHYQQQRHGVDLRTVKRWTAEGSACVVCGDPTGQQVDLRRFCSHSCESKWHRHGGEVPKSGTCEACGDVIVYGPREGMRSVPVGTRLCPGKHRRSGADYGMTVDDLATRDGFLCSLCGDGVDLSLKWPAPMSPTRDHVIPYSLGGTHSPENLRLAHFVCNSKKGNRVKVA